MAPLSLCMILFNAVSFCSLLIMEGYRSWAWSWKTPNTVLIMVQPFFSPHLCCHDCPPHSSGSFTALSGLLLLGGILPYPLTGHAGPYGRLSSFWHPVMITLYLGYCTILTTWPNLKSPRKSISVSDGLNQGALNYIVLVTLLEVGSLSQGGQQHFRGCSWMV